MSDVDDALAELLHFSGRRTRGHNSVSTMRALLAALGDPQLAYPVIHVAGTSGKTSTCYAIRDLLTAGGVRTGMTVSPHIVSVTERVQVQGVPLSDAAFVDYVAAFLPLARATGLDLTYFELVVALALWIFAAEEVEYAVVEVGIGGGRDATNAIVAPSKACVITAVGFDHTEVLGESLPQIAAAKAGIIGPGNRCWVIDQDPTVLEVISDRAASQGAPLTVVGVEPRARYREQNLALATQVVTDLGFGPPANTLVGDPPARFEKFTRGGTEVILDGAHNPQKLTALTAELAASGVSPVAVLASFLKAPEAKLEASLAVLAPVVTRLLVCEFTLGDQDKVKRSFPADEVVSAARALGIDAVVVDSLDAGLAQLVAGGEPRVVVTGSLYLSALIRPLLVAGDH